MTSPASPLTAAEASYIARVLHRRAGDRAKDLESARIRECHPSLIRDIENDLAECTRLALKLQGVPP